MSVRVSTILERKGDQVWTIAPDATVGEAADKLREHDVGALVVSEDEQTVAGIISERDIIRRLASLGPECLNHAVADVMSTAVTTCTRDATADDLMATMTSSRFRHIPVVEEDELVGIISIGDVVKSRIDELEITTESLKEYVTGSGY